MCLLCKKLWIRVSCATHGHAVYPWKSRFSGFHCGTGCKACPKQYTDFKRPPGIFWAKKRRHISTRHCTRKEISAAKRKRQKCCPFPFCLRQESCKGKRITVNKYPASGLLYAECFCSQWYSDLQQRRNTASTKWIWEELQWDWTDMAYLLKIWRKWFVFIGMY